MPINKRVLYDLPVPQGWSLEQAWEAISRGEVLTDADPEWTTVELAEGRLKVWRAVPDDE